MKQHIRALAFLAALLPSWALAQSAPATMPYHTVFGRLGAAPGDTGPGQAIPFATLLAQLSGAQSANKVYAGPTSGAANVPTFRLLVGADLPVPGASSLGGVKSLTCSSSSWFNTLSTAGALGCSQPAFTDVTGVVALSQLPSGVMANVLNAKTANYTIANTDCGKNIQAGTGATGNFTITLPSVSGFPATCAVLITNGDTGRGKKLSGFPADVAATWHNLGPLQSVGMQIVNGVWATYYNPGRWQTSNEVFFVDPASGSDANDGLAAGSGNAFQTIGQAINVFYASVSHNYGPVPTINVLSGSTVTESVVITGQPVGVLGVIIQGNGGAFNWNNSTTFCMEVGDMAIVEIFNITFNCGTAAATNFGIFAHNQAVIDVFTGVTFGNMGSNGDDIHCDFQSQINLNSSYTITGTKAKHINLISHCVLSDGSITVTASGTPTIATFMSVFGGSYVNAFSGNYSGAYTAGMKQWDVQGNSVLPNDSKTIPGSVAGTTANGGLVCSNC